MEERLKKELSRIAQHPIQWDCPLAPFTSFGIGGPADAVISVDSIGELADLIRFFAKNGLDWRLIGRGSNLLVADSGFRGIILLFGSRLSGIAVSAESAGGAIQIRVGGGCSLTRLSNWCTERGYSGLEFAAGIPGSVGGAVVMNAGAHGGQMADVITSVHCFSLHGGAESLLRRELDFRYRVWANQETGKEKRLLVSADIRLRRGEPDAMQARCRKYLAERREKQPKGLKNCGSFFKNPAGDSAGRLIEASGLKGRECGGAMVSTVHANFLVNSGGATAEDVKQLMTVVIDQVQKDSGLVLQPEVHFL